LTLSVDAAERDARSDSGSHHDTVRSVGSEAAPSHGALVWTDFTSEAYIAALKADRPFVMGFSAEWCVPCREMYERTYTDQRVIEAGDGVGFLEVDSTEASDFIARVMESFDVKGLPTTLFFDSGGQEHTRRGGFISASEFARLLDDTKKAAPPMPTTSPSAI
jgi:thiol:disulfide interchange protein